MCKLRYAKTPGGGTVGSTEVRKAGGQAIFNSYLGKTVTKVIIDNSFASMPLRIFASNFSLPSCPPSFCSSDLTHPFTSPPLKGGEKECSHYPSPIGEGATHVANSNNIRRAAFTLAEVLITLGIIGVVAAMTIPSVIQKTQNRQLQTAFKAAYSLLSQAVLSGAEEEGGNLTKFYTTYTTDGGYINGRQLSEKLYSKLKVIGTCEYNQNIRTYNKLSDNVYIDRGSPTPDKALANGMCFNVSVNANTLNLSIDITGVKGPNILGHDIFFFDIDENDRVYPKKASSHIYTEEELEKMYPGQSDYAVPQQLGDPCSYNSSQRGNGLGCAYYALIDKNPDDATKGYWESLP